MRSVLSLRSRSHLLRCGWRLGERERERENGRDEEKEVWSLHLVDLEDEEQMHVLWELLRWQP